MNASGRKRIRNDARSKFRNLWIERKQTINGNYHIHNGENDEKSFDLSDSKEFPSLNGDSIVKKIHVPKKKYALAFGFLGTSYHGYQKQVEYKTGVMDKVKTVEGTMEDCLIQVGGINELFRNMTHKLQMSKCSRTDKGVHAACTYIGGRFNLEPNDHESSNESSESSQTSRPSDDNLNHFELNGNGVKSNGYEVSDGILSTPDRELSKEEIFINRLNSILPQDIRCFKIQRVTKGFDARSMCSKRKYEYVLPEWVLCRAFQLPNEDHQRCFNNLHNLIEENFNKKDPIKLSRGNEGLYENIGHYIETEMDFDRFQNILKQYEGTHDFYNFTVKQKLESHNTLRYIHKISVKKDRLDDLDVIKIMIVGQSFLYNQIRKMVALGLQIYLNISPENSIKFALNKNHILNINVVPSEGLILHHPYFESYNITRCNPPDVPYIEYKDIKKDVESFKSQFIYPEIKRSIDSNIWEGWLDNNLKYPFYLDNQNITGGECIQ